MFFRLEQEKSIEIGALGEKVFRPGIYAYVGSAMTSLESRVWRHMSGEKENLHWHIDYFSVEAEPLGFAAFATDSNWECRLSESLSEKSQSIRDFGASDCNCSSHLYRLPPDQTFNV